MPHRSWKAKGCIQRNNRASRKVHNLLQPSLSWSSFILILESLCHMFSHQARPIPQFYFHFHFISILTLPPGLTTSTRSSLGGRGSTAASSASSFRSRASRIRTSSLRTLLLDRTSQRTLFRRLRRCVLFYARVFWNMCFEREFRQRGAACSFLTFCFLGLQGGL